MTITGTMTRTLAAVVLATTAAHAWADSAADVKALLAVDRAYEEATNRGDAQAVANLYAKDAVLLPPGAPPVKGRDAIKAYYVADIAASTKAGVVLALGPDPQCGASGDLGWCSGTFAAKDKAGKVVDTGKYLSVSRKEGGKWLYFRDTWNSDGTPAPVVPAKK